MILRATIPTYILVVLFSHPLILNIFMLFFCTRWIEMVIQRLKKLEAVIFFVSPLIFIFFFMLTFIVDGQIYEYISQNEKSNE